MATVARILAIDDEPGMRAGIPRALRHFVVRVPTFDEEVTFEIETAGSAEEGFEKIASFKPDLILLDHKLPGLSGLDVLRWIQDHDLDLLTIMITAYASLDSAIKATKRGAYDFLAKPFTPVELKSAVRKATKHLVLRRKARALAEERRQVRFQFISVLAHELKAPLGAVEGFLQIIKDKSAGDDPAVYDELIDRTVVRLHGMRKLIYDLLDLTRIESGNKKRDLQTVDVVAAARTAMENVQNDAKARGIEIRFIAPDALPMKADPGEVEIILNNLVSNAVKYNRDGGKVDVTLQAEGGKISITVTDTGIGMASEEVAKLFGDFVRIKNQKTRGIMGSGLGLSIVKKLVELYAGEISVQSTPDVGTTFRAVLDADAPPPTEKGDQDLRDLEAAEASLEER